MFHVAVARSMDLAANAPAGPQIERQSTANDGATRGLSWKGTAGMDLPRYSQFQQHERERRLED